MKKSKKFVRLAAHITPIRYKIMIKPDFGSFTFYGEETIQVKVDKPTKEIVIHAHEIEIAEVKYLYGEEKTVQAIKTFYDANNQTAKLVFSAQLPKGKGELKLKFRGIINDKMRGFYRSRYMVDGQERYLATTQFEATYARQAFPCFDEPSKKAIFDVTMMVPAGKTVISNTIPASISEHESGYQIVEFLPTPKMSTYLLAFIVGDFEYIEGKTKEGVVVRVFVTPGKKDQAKFALDVAIKTLSFYSDYFGIPYPLPVLDLIAIPDFAHGAMENWGAVTYRESTLLVDPEGSSESNKQWVALVIAHELAHQWFGNLVTMEWWTHLWLNEGFASYIEYLAIDHIFPDWDIWTQFVYREKGVALELDGLKNTHPIEVEVGNPNEIGEIFDRVSYSKGASVIRMLAEYLGPQDFRKGLSHYLKKHQFDNAKTSDLWKALEEVSKKEVDQIMQNWTAREGYPLVTVTHKKDNLYLTQERFFTSSVSKKDVKDKTTWKIPISVLHGKKETYFLISKKSLVIPNIKKEDWVKLNGGEASFIRVKYSKSLLEILKKMVSSRKVNTVDRLGIIRDIFDLCEPGDISTAEALSFATSFQEEEDFNLWSEITSQLRQVSDLIANENFYKMYENYCLKLLEQIVNKLGWEKKSKEKHTDIMLRTIILYYFGYYGDKETIEHAQKLFQQVLNGKSIDPDLRSVVYNLVAKYGGEKEHHSFLNLYKKEELQQEKDRIGQALGAFHDSTLLSKTLEFSLSEDVRPQSIIGIISAVFANPFGRDIAWNFVKNHWSILVEKFSGGHMLGRLIQAGSGFTDIKKAEDIKTFFKKNPTPEARRAINQTLEQIRSNATWLSRDKKGINHFLKASKLINS